MSKFMPCLSAAVLMSTPSYADDIVPPKIYTVSPGNVSMTDGSYIQDFHDLSIGDMRLDRYYYGSNSDANVKSFGNHIASSFDIFVAGNVTTQPYRRYKPIIHLGNSASGTYVKGSTNDIVGPVTEDAGSGKLDYVNGAYVYTSHEGVVYTFNPNVVALGVAFSQRVASIVYPNGRNLSFSYNGSGQLKTVVDSTGYAIVMDYNGSGLVATACGFNLASTYVSLTTTCAGAGLKVTYSYTSGNLTQVTDVMGGVTNISYNSNNHIVCIKPPGFSACKVSNTYSPTAANQVTQQSMADGTVWNYEHHTSQHVLNPMRFTSGNSSYTDPLGRVKRFYFSGSSPTAIVDENGQTTQYIFKGAYDNDWVSDEMAPAYEDYHSGSILVQAKFPEQNMYAAENGGPYNSLSKETLKAKLSSNLPDLVKQYGYPPCPSGTAFLTCTQPIWIRDAKDGQTDFIYASHGGVISEMAPAPSGGAARPLKLYTYVQKYAYIRNSGVDLVPASSGMWLLQSETQCQTASGSSVPSCDGAAPQIVTVFEYGADGTANNLLLRGKVVSSAGASLRTCYSYDSYGNRVSETKPRAGLGGCP